jgi:hypothetical protein
MTLTEFLLARIAEDEHFGTHDRHLSNRWAAECEAKRRIMALHSAYPSRGPDGGIFCGTCGDPLDYYAVDWPCPTVCALAEVYSGHPDYDESWRLTTR